MKVLKLIFLMIIFTARETVYSVSLVYNMKIRRAISAHVFEHIFPGKTNFWLLTALPIVYTRSRHIVAPLTSQDLYEKTLLAGSVFNVRFLAPHYWWLEFTTGLENQTDHTCGTQTFKDSRTGFDDIVLTAGKNFFFHDEKGQISFYAIGGVPTKFQVTPQETYDTLVGTRFFGLGAGGELSYSFIKSLKQALIGILQARCVHFFDRAWSPILPCGAQIQPGNLTDLFLIMQYRHKVNIFEVGYNPTFFTNQAALLPTEKIKSPNIVRNSFYANFIHVFKKSLLLKKPGGIGTGINISRSETFDTKIFAWWINLSLLF
jgi:hypothetical protein